MTHFTIETKKSNIFHISLSSPPNAIRPDDHKSALRSSQKN